MGQELHGAHAADTPIVSLGRGALVIAFCLWACAGGLLFSHLDRGSLANSDDSIYAVMAREAHASGHIFETTYNGFPVFEKPPLFQWALVAAFGALGENDRAARLPDAMASFLVLGLVFIAASVGRRNTGALVAGATAVAYLLSSDIYYFSSRRVLTDLPFLLGILLFLLPLAGRHGTRRLILSGIGAGGAILCKGPAFALPALAVLLWLGLTGDLRRLRFREWLAWVGPALLLAGPWHVWQVMRHGRDFLSTYLGYHVVKRATGTLYQLGGLGDFLRNIVEREGVFGALLLGGGLVLALTYAVRAIPSCTRRLDATTTASNGADFAARLDLLLGLFAAVWMTVLLLMRTRMDHYTIPLFGIAAVSLGRAAATLVGRMRASFAAVLVSACFIAMTVQFARNNTFHLLVSDYSHNLRVLSEAARGSSTPIVALEHYNVVTPWYLDRKVELWTTQSRMCGILDSVDMFRRSRTVWCARPEDLAARLAAERPVVLTRTVGVDALRPLLPGYRELVVDDVTGFFPQTAP